MTAVYELRHTAPYMSVKALAATFGHSDKWTRQAVREMQDVLLERYSLYDIVGHGKRLLVNTAAFLDFLKFREMLATYPDDVPDFDRQKAMDALGYFCEEVKG